VNVKDKTKAIYEVESGDIILLDGIYYLVCPHPEQKCTYYLPSLDGFTIYGSNGRTLEEICDIVNDEGGIRYSKNEFEISLIPIQ
jgi:hypothetical protein